MNILKSYEEPTDIFILGFNLKSTIGTFFIRDDEHSLDILQIGGRDTSIVTQGSVDVVTLEELISLFDSKSENELNEINEEEEDYREFIKIHNFVGDLKVTMRNYQTGETLNVKMDFENEDEQLVAYQDEVYNAPEDFDLCLIVPEGFKMVKDSVSNLRTYLI